MWSDKCDYIDPRNCSNLNPDGYNLTILQLNIRSLLVHQTDLKLLLNLLNKKKTKVDAVLLCETFLTKQTNQLVNIPGYVLINKNRTNSRGCGVAILLKDNVPYKKWDDITTMIEKEVESVYVETTCRNGTKLLLGSLYRAPNTNGKVSYGHDRISNSMLKNLCTSISYPLQVIFNQSIDQGLFPSKMKLAEVIPLYKGKEHDKVINYRPISLLITISKLLEKIIYKRLYLFLEKNKLLFERQYGFRSK